MKKEKFELGPIQKQWISNLRKYPERQAKGILGEKKGDSYRACCLGEGLLCLKRSKGEELPFDRDGYLFDGDMDVVNVGDFLFESYKDLGLLSEKGEIATTSNEVLNHLVNSFPYQTNYTLAYLNDIGTTWPQIADFIEKFPEAVFTKPV